MMYSCLKTVYDGIRIIIVTIIIFFVINIMLCIVLTVKCYPHELKFTIAVIMLLFYVV